MRTIQTTLTVEPGGRAVIQLPPDVEPGTHRAVLVLNMGRPDDRPTMADFPRYDVTLSPDAPKRWDREELYEDGDRGA